MTTILELCLSPSFGGLEIHMRDFSRWLAERKDVTLHIALQRGSRIEQSLADLTPQGIVFPSHAGKLPVRKARRLAHYIDKHAVDVVHVHWKNDLPLAALAKRMVRRSVRLVHTRQMSLPGKKRDPYHSAIYRSLDCLIAITREVARQAESNLPIPRERIRQIYYGVARPSVDPQAIVDIRRSLQLEGHFVVGVVGRITEPKGQHLLIEAVDALSSMGHRVMGLIVGEPFEPPYVERLRRMVTERSLTDRIRFMPFHPRPAEVMSACDVVALTTRSETFGLVLVEAMRCGVAVVGSRAEGVPEIIDDGKTGLLFTPGDANSLADAIGRLADDTVLVQRLALAGKRSADERFDQTVQFEKFYAALCGPS